jgi:nucleotidyltransferase substrate binding protein (TIGR01987 family)
MEVEDIRWKQRFSNYGKALKQMERFVQKRDSLNELEEQGLIQAFEYTFELAWNTMKDFLENQGHEQIFGSRSAIQESFRIGLIQDGSGWMELFAARNKTSHTYNEETAKEILQLIFLTAMPLFASFRSKIETLL